MSQSTVGSTHKRFEGTFAGYKQARLYFQKWEAPNAIGTVIITHGHGEHSDGYQRVIEAISQDSKALWNIAAWDWRGHGRSEGTRGYAANFFEYCYDFELFVAQLLREEQGPKKPIVFLSHSMGGLIQLKVLLEHPEWPVAAQVLSAPLLDVAVHVPAYKELAASALIHLLPKVTLWNEITYNMLTRDPEIIKEFEKDPLRHDRICAGVYLGSKECMSIVRQKARKVSYPTLLQVSDSDPIVSTNAALEFMDNIPHEFKAVKIYPGFKHEIYNDLGREEVLGDLTGFLSKIASSAKDN